MRDQSPRRRTAVIIAILLLLLLLVFLLMRCVRPREVATPATPPPPQSTATSPAPAPPPLPGPATPDEVLTPATIQAPAEVGAGVAFAAAWTGPGNSEDYLTIVRLEASPRDYANYTLVRAGSPLRLTAPIEAGDWEIRYVAARSRNVLGRAPLKVLPATAALDAAGEITLDTPLTVTWTGPNNVGDYITLVGRDQPDSASGNYALTNKGSPVTITAPPATGDAELRYVTGQDRKVLARRPIRITQPDASLAAPGEAIAGATVPVDWKGPGNEGDYLTVVPAGTPDGQYRNYTTLKQLSPALVTMGMDPGPAELRYMTGRGGQVLARRPISIVAAEITLEAPAEAAAGAAVSIAWTGPAHAGDYLTIVARSASDRQFGHYTLVGRNPALSVNAPKEPGPCEVRYVSGQGGKVLARRPITITP